ncbi:unnamed protein product [Boreogadus saida]
MAAIRQRGADTAAAIAERADDFTVPLDDALSLLVSSESDDSDRDEEGASPPASPLQTEWPGAAALPVSAATSLPVVGALVAELPGIIARAAPNLGLAVPMPQGPQRPDQLCGIWGLEAATRPSRPDLADVSRHQPVLQWGCGGARETRCPGENIYPGHEDRGYRAVPPLVSALCAVFGVKPGLSDRCPTPKDQLTAKLTDGAHRSARTAAWQHLIQRNLWLQQTPGIPEPMRRQLLECPISPDVLFGPRLSSMVDDMQAASEDTSPAIRLQPVGSAPLQAPVAAIGPRQSVSRRRRQLLLLAPRLTSPARLHRRLWRPASEGPGQRAHGPMFRPTSAGEGNYGAREKRVTARNTSLLKTAVFPPHS